MARNSDRQYSVLIVSTSEQFNMVVKRSLPGGRFKTIEIKKSASTAGRALLERGYELVIINSPLSDELGVDFAMETVLKYNANVILTVPNPIYDDVTEKLVDHGVITIPKPIDMKALSRGIRIACAMQDKIISSAAKIKKLENKMEELRLINRAKLILVEKGMSEDEAHEYIIRKAMDNGLTKRQVADEIIDD